jgi:hypothetical protein
MSTPPEGWKQGQKSNIYEANITQVKTPTATTSIVGETDKTTGSYTVYSTALPNFAGGRSAIYTVSASGAVKVENETLYNTLKSQGDISKLDNSIKPKAYQINQTFGTDAEKKTVSESTLYKSEANKATVAGTITDVSLGNQLQETGNQRDKAGSFGNHRYPENLGSTKQDIIKFTMLKYVPQKITSRATFEGGDLGAFSNVNRSFDKRESLGTVILPTPSGISETNGVEWGGQTMGPGEALAANVALVGISKGLKEAANQVSGAIQGSTNSGTNAAVQTAVTTGFAQAAANVGNLLSRTQGAVFNPNLELLFNGPTLRPFSFTFKMSARSKKEADQIIKIIRFFKQGMSPQKTQSSLFLKAPHTFRIQYLYRPAGANKDHPYIGQIKECALQNFIVNYTPEGQYATFDDGVMVSYEIQMQFQELEPVFNEDYGGNGDLPTDLLFR